MMSGPAGPAERHLPDELAIQSNRHPRFAGRNWTLWRRLSFGDRHLDLADQLEIKELAQILALVERREASLRSEASRHALVRGGIDNDARHRNEAPQLDHRTRQADR